MLNMVFWGMEYLVKKKTAILNLWLYQDHSQVQCITKEDIETTVLATPKSTYSGFLAVRLSKCPCFLGSESQKM